jgi:hypothetical protein
MHPGAKLIFFGHKYYTKSEHTYFSVGVLDFFWPYLELTHMLLCGLIFASISSVCRFGAP